MVSCGNRGFLGAGKKVVVYLADPEVDESELPPQFHGNLWTADAKRLVRAIREENTGRVQKTTNGYCTSLGAMTIKVSLGRIEETDCSEENCLIMLPANEFFDDERSQHRCIQIQREFCPFDF
jgi:hypothetical protein